MCFYVLDSLVDSVRGGQTVIRFKTEPKTEIIENRKRPKMKIETETLNNRNRKTEMLQEKPKTISFSHIFFVLIQPFYKGNRKTETEN